MNNYIKHALREFENLGWLKKEDPDGIFDSIGGAQRAICLHIIKLLNVFADENHSGTTASYAVGLFKSLAMFEPIGPLTGEDFEWNLVDHENDICYYQNKRCGSVFKDKNGQAYNINGKVFIDKDGCTYTNRKSKVFIDFPYTPQKKYVYRGLWNKIKHLRIKSND